MKIVNHQYKKYQFAALFLACVYFAFSALQVCAAAADTGVSRASGSDSVGQNWKESALAGVAASDYEVILLRTPEDLLQMEKDCVLDTYSVGKTFRLANDIDLAGSSFHSIPTFGGVFDGNGHKITGFSVTQSGDVKGFFRYVQQDAVVMNLTVEGKAAPVDRKNTVGGLAGTNYGKLVQCTFIGSVKGKISVGGLVGINETTGQMINCSFQGDVSGEHYVGGVAGQNLGSLIQCRNEGNINITEVKSTLDVTEINLDIGSLNSSENTPACTDIGGVAGFSSGILQSCENAGNVGYEHLGYNVGGVVGRTSGYLDGCKNTGLVLGRKDVGGIAGQMEPCVLLRYSPDQLADLWSQLDTLQKMMGTALDHAKSASSDVSVQLGLLADSAETVKTAADGLSESMTDWADENMQKVEDISAKISWAITRLSPAVTELDGVFDAFAQSLSYVKQAVEAAGIVLPEELTEAVCKLAESIEACKEASSAVLEDLDALTQALGNEQEMQRAKEKLMGSLGTLSEALEDMRAAVETVRKALIGMQEEGGLWGLALLIPALEKQEEACSKMADAADGLKEVLENQTDGSLSSALLADSAAQLLEAGNAMKSAGQTLAAALNSLAGEKGAGLKESYEQLLEVLGKVQEESEKLFDEEEASEAESALTTESTESEAEEGAEKSEEDTSDISEEQVSSEEPASPEEPVSSEESAALDEAGAYFALEQTVSTGDSVDKEELLSFLEEMEEVLQDMEKALSDLGLTDGKEEQILQKMEEIYRKIEAVREAAREELEDAVSELKGSVEALESIFELLDFAGEKAGTSAKLLQKAAESAKDGFTDFSNITGSVRSVLKELGQESAVSFTPLGSAVNEKKDTLDSALSDLSARFSGLESVMNTSSDALLTDLRAIHEQTGVIFDLIKKSADEGTQETVIGSSLEDISDEVSEEDKNVGRISGSVNLGEVRGDVNVAGIVGSLAIEYDFDPEDDLVESGERSFNFAYQARALVSDCISSAKITSKKDYVGGIVGRMDLGQVKSCESYGEIVSSGGDYVGGIAGASSAYITDSWAKCRLSGNDYVGGIAGEASSVKNSHSLVEIENANANVGTIAGGLAEDGVLSGNTYVHESIGAVDSISYAGKAEAAAYDELLALEDAPEQFKQFEITFVAEDKVIGVSQFQYGKGIEKLPEIPAKKGYTGKWPELDYSHLYFDRIVEAEYVPYDTAIARNRGSLQLLVDGSFSPDAEIEQSAEAESFTDESGRTHSGTAYRVKVLDPNLEQITFNVHLKVPEDISRFRIWRKSGEGWETASYVKDGSYVLLDSQGDEIVFLLEETRLLWPWILGGAAAFIGTAVLICVLIKRKKKKSHGKKKGRRKKSGML